MIRDSEAAARRAWDETMDRNGVEADRRIEPARPVLGTPEAVAERLQGYVDAGFGTVLYEVPAPYDIETLERLVGDVKPLVDAG